MRRNALDYPGQADGPATGSVPSPPAVGTVAAEGPPATITETGVTLQLLWEEYFQVHPNGYRYTQFCEIYRQWARRLRPSMRQVHRAGEKTFIDFSSKRPTLVDGRTGAARRVELFVAVLGASSLTYAEATETQQLPDWVGAHIRMVEYFGGATTLWVPDQLFTVTNGDVTGARRKNGQHDEWTIGVQFRLSGRDRWTCPSVSEVASARPLAFASVPAPPWSVLNGTSAPPCAVR